MRNARAGIKYSLLGAGIALSALSACSTRNPFADALWYYQPVEGSNISPHVHAGPYLLDMYEGNTGVPLTWTDLWEGMHWADIVIVGEQHDDATAHLVQVTLVQQAMAAFPGSVVSMEMLERDEQQLVDEYVAGTLPLDDFINQTESRNWAGKDTWLKYYQPMIDAARDHAAEGSRVIAANSPRIYVRKARLEGYDALAALPPEERALFDFPAQAPSAKYRERFRDFMTEDGKPPSDEDLDRGLQPQRLWDATMAASVAEAYRKLPKRAKIIHVVGQFHSEYEGGLVTEIEARASGARILTISVQRDEAPMLREEDRGKADVVVYGVAPAPTWSAVKSRRKSTPAPEGAVEGELPEWGYTY